MKVSAVWAHAGVSPPFLRAASLVDSQPVPTLWSNTPLDLKLQEYDDVG